MPGTGTFLRTLPQTGSGLTSQPPPSAAVSRCSGGLRRRGTPFVARRGMNPRTAALNLTAPPSCGCYAPYRGPKAQRGVPRSGLWSEEWESPRSGVRYASGTGSERAKVASVAEGNPPLARALPLEAASPGGVPVGVRRFRFGVPVPVPVVLSHGKSVRGVGQP